MDPIFAVLLFIGAVWMITTPFPPTSEPEYMVIQIPKDQPRQDIGCFPFVLIFLIIILSPFLVSGS